MICFLNEKKRKEDNAERNLGRGYKKMRCEELGKISEWLASRVFLPGGWAEPGQFFFSQRVDLIKSGECDKKVLRYFGTLSQS